ncbi:MAG: SIS domain-containing protein [Dehalococcoidia bacterium]
MRARIEAFPREARRAWESGLTWPLPADFRAPARVVVCGMGGSATGGDFLRAYLRRTLPVEVVRDYELPPCDAHTLLIASSFSGNTEETLAAFASPQAATAMRLALTTGGRLDEVARATGTPLMAFECDGPPRTAWEYGFLPVLALLGRLGLVDTTPAEAALAAIETQAPVLEAFAVALAPQFADRIPFIVGAEHLAPVARRWAAQVNENAKRVAFFGEVPEVNHNFLLGLTDARAAGMVAVLLDSTLISSRTRKRLDLTERILEQRGVPHERVLIPGASEVDSMLRGSLLGDWLSWELARMEGVDPSDTAVLEQFKADLVTVPPVH